MLFDGLGLRELWQVWVLFAGYGVYYGIVEGVRIQKRFDFSLSGYLIFAHRRLPMGKKL